MSVREGQVWRNKRTGRACVVKYVRLGTVSYRYFLPENHSLIMKLVNFREAFQLVEIQKT